MKQRILALMLAGTLSLSLMSTGALAAEGEAPAKPEDNPAAEEYIPDPVGSISFANVGWRMRENNLQIKALQENAKLLAFLQGNGITSMQELCDKVAAMNDAYYDLRGKIVKAERRLAVLDERLEMWAQYQKYKPVRQKLDKVSPGKREQFEQRHSADLALFDAAVRYLDTLKASGEAITPKAWRAEAQRLTAEKEADYLQMRAMREDIKAVETLKKTAERLAREGQTQHREEQER